MHVLPSMADYSVPQRPWEMTEVIYSLITFARYMLKPCGRLVFFLPTENAQYHSDDIPNVTGMRLVANSLQDYGNWGRRLITMEKVAGVVIENDPSDRGIEREALSWGDVTLGEVKPREATTLGHENFRDRYFKSFAPVEGSSEGP